MTQAQQPGIHSIGCRVVFVFVLIETDIVRSGELRPATKGSLVLVATADFRQQPKAPLCKREEGLLFDVEALSLAATHNG